jgi:plastocyanin
MRLSRKWLGRVSTFALAALAVTDPLGAAAQAREYTVAIANMAFGPIPSGLKVGDTIVWANKDSVPHTVTARDHSFDLRIGPGQSGRVSLAKPGSYQIYCILHSPMRGSFTVGK